MVCTTKVIEGTYLVSATELNEARFRVRMRADVRVMILRQIAVRSLELRRSGRLVHLQHLIQLCVSSSAAHEATPRHRHRHSDRHCKPCTQCSPSRLRRLTRFVQDFGARVHGNLIRPNTRTLPHTRRETRPEIVEWLVVSLRVDFSFLWRSKGATPFVYVKKFQVVL